MKLLLKLFPNVLEVLQSIMHKMVKNDAHIETSTKFIATLNKGAYESCTKTISLMFEKS